MWTLVLAKIVGVRDYLYLAIFLAFVGFVLYERHHLIAEGETKILTEVKKTSAAAEQKADALVAKLTAEHIAEVAKIKGETGEQLKAISDLHDSDAERLREYDAYRRTHTTVPGTSAGQRPSQSADEGANGLERQLASLEQVALGLAASGSEVDAALSACINERDSLTGK